jgi:hypothetical protein
MQLAGAYILFILVGPAIFVALIQAPPTRQRFVMGAASALGLMGAAFVLRGLGTGTGPDTLGWTACLWLGWIVTIATAVQAWALVRGMGRQRKWSAAMGAAAVTLPWFGLSLAVTTG